MTVIPTAYFPSILYLQAFFNAEDACIELHEHFQKQSIRSRCEILTANGTLRLSVPTVHESGKKILTKDLRIDQTGTWKNDHWRAIQSAYALAPYFEDYAQEVKEIIFSADEFLWEKNQRCLQLILDVVDSNKSVHYTTTFQGITGETSKNAYLGRESWQLPSYQQVFSYDRDFTPNLSMIDLLLNEGPFIRNWILTTKN